MLRFELFPCGPIERKTGAKPLALVASTPGQGSSDTARAAVAAIVERFFPDLLAAAERAMAGDAPKEQEWSSSASWPGWGRCCSSASRGGSSVYTSVPSECLDDIKRSAVKRMGLEFDSSKEHYHVKSQYCDLNTLQVRVNTVLGSRSYGSHRNSWLTSAVSSPQNLRQNGIPVKMCFPDAGIPKYALKQACWAVGRTAHQKSALCIK